MSYTLGAFTVDHDRIDDVIKACEEYVAAVRQNEPSRTVEFYRVEYTNRFYLLLEFEDDEDQKAHRQTPYMQKLMESVRGGLLNDIDFVELQIVASSRPH